MNSATDLTLLHRIQQADAPAMAELYRRHSAVVYSIALRVATATALAEQVLADVFLQIWRTPDRFLPLAANLPAALIFIARNRAVALTRSQPSPADFQLPAWLAILQPNASTREQALAALAQIPADRREILERAFFLDPHRKAESGKSASPTALTLWRSGFCIESPEFAAEVQT